MSQKLQIRDGSQEREAALQTVLTVWIISGLAFLVLPGTFLGVWNLVGISGQHGTAQVTPEWIQAHGHAQIVGWIGSFILGIGFYSLSKMGGLGAFAVHRAWLSWVLWSSGVLLRWITNLEGWQWRTALPLSAVLELVAFLIFFQTVSRHRAPGENAVSSGGRPVWMLVVMASTLGFLAVTVVNAGIAVHSAVVGSGPAVEHGLDQRVLPLYTWGFAVMAIWGFSARWLPVFLGRPAPHGRLLLLGVGTNVSGVIAAFFGAFEASTVLALCGAMLATVALRVMGAPERAPKTAGIHPSFPAFVRVAYVWLLCAAVLGVAAPHLDRAGGLWGASRHALTVGFMSTMVFAIGQRVLPAFCGMRVLFSPRLMFASLFLLNCGCALRVGAEVGAYEGIAPALWPVLPVSAVTELAAVALFAASLLATFAQPPAHLRHAA